MKKTFKIIILIITISIISLNSNKQITIKSNKYYKESKNILTFRDTQDNILMTSDVISKAEPIQNEKTGENEISLTVKDKDKFYEVTKKVSESEDPYIVIWINFDETKDSYYKYDEYKNIIGKEKCGNLKESHCLSSAAIRQGFASDVVIQGKFTLEETKEIVSKINNSITKEEIKLTKRKEEIDPEEINNKISLINKILSIFIGIGYIIFLI